MVDNFKKLQMLHHSYRTSRPSTRCVLNRSKNVTSRSNCKISDVNEQGDEDVGVAEHPGFLGVPPRPECPVDSWPVSAGFSPD
jgi:hypothetical protein